MIVTNRMQIWAELPKFEPLTPEGEVFFGWIARIVGGLLWAGFVFIVVRAIVLNIWDRRARRRAND